MSSTTKHYHQLDTARRRVRVLRAGRVLADSTRTILLKEVGHQVYDPVFYFPPDDVDLSGLESSASRTTCPIKGEANYLSIREADDQVEDIAWTYEEPVHYSRPIAGYVAFDPRYVAFELGHTTES